MSVPTAPILPVVTPTPQAAPPGLGDMLQCVVNVSEGRDAALLASLAEVCGSCLLDLHRDVDHNRSVFTLAGAAGVVAPAARELAGAVVGLLDLSRHSGVHPRLGTLDVVPWVAPEGWPLRDASPGPLSGRARQARDDFAVWAARELDLPVFLYGPERSLPEVRRHAWRSLGPDLARAPHPRAGAVAVGCRPLMVAYNLWLAEPNLSRAKDVAVAVRSPTVRALAFSVGNHVQVSCNLIAPFVFGPAAIWDRVAEMAAVARAELVGLVPQAVLDQVPEERWAQLDLAPGEDDRGATHRPHPGHRVTARHAPALSS